MDPVMLTILIKGIGMVLLIVGGVVQIIFGHKLYKDGLASSPEKSILQYGKFKLQTNTVGTLVMGTAAFWASAAVMISPTLKKDRDKLEVASFYLQGAMVQSPKLAISTSHVNVERAVKDPEKLKALFAEAAKTASKPKSKLGLLTIDKKLAHFDFDSLGTKKSESGQLFVTSDIFSEGKTAQVTYSPEIDMKTISFTPVAVGVGQKNIKEGKGTLDGIPYDTNKSKSYGASAPVSDE